MQISMSSFPTRSFPEQPSLRTRRRLVVLFAVSNGGLLLTYSGMMLLPVFFSGLTPLSWFLAIFSVLVPSLTGVVIATVRLRRWAALTASSRSGPLDRSVVDLQQRTKPTVTRITLIVIAGYVLIEGTAFLIYNGHIHQGIYPFFVAILLFGMSTQWVPPLVLAWNAQIVSASIRESDRSVRG